ncbi:hypothetical protein TWF788_001177 [Orbilia oligospora]|uniref:F-box domain-containing protein n=1 Tax=Orbilia oligospora TaxID=2813651 RepID=A0A7C8PLZ6_ORBOL|nr:hypothetical protein TWF788_001177 [Orbilia oligospora]KAF3214413.1 hypothetical protein TWF679_004787 [Orbilia oligospora]
MSTTNSTSPPDSPLQQLTLDDLDIPETEAETEAETSGSNVVNSIESIPLELRLSILSYLNIKEIKQFSLCSRVCRIASLPILYRRLNLAYVYNSAIDRGITPTTRLDQIRAAFLDPDGSLHNLQDIVRHVTIDTENLSGYNNIIAYYRGWVSLLPLFPALNSIKIRYYSPSASAYSPSLYEFDTRLFNSTCSRLMETCTAYRTLKFLHVKTSEYRFSDPALSSRPKRIEPLSDEDEIFMGLNPGESALKYATPDTIPCPEALEEVYFDIDFRSKPRGDVIDPMIFTRSSTNTLKKLGVWLDLHKDRNRNLPLFPEGIDLTRITDLGLCLDFLNVATYLTKVGTRIPNVVSLSLYVDQGSVGGFWEEEAIKAYGRIVGAWLRTLKRMRVPWFTASGDYEGEDGRTERVKSWFETNELSKLERVVLVKDTPEEWFEAQDCLITRVEQAREFKWSEVYLAERLPLDGL